MRQSLTCSFFLVFPRRKPLSRADRGTTHGSRRSRQSQLDSTSLSKSYGNPRAKARRETTGRGQTSRHRRSCAALPCTRELRPPDGTLYRHCCGPWLQQLGQCSRMALSNRCLLLVRPLRYEVERWNCDDSQVRRRSHDKCVIYTERSRARPTMTKISRISCGVSRRVSSI